MTIALQPSLFESEAEAPAFGPLAGRVRRTPLAYGAWVDHLPGWLDGADQLFAALVDTVPWQAERRQMYDRVVDVPRLLCFYGETAELTGPVEPPGRGRRASTRGSPTERIATIVSSWLPRPIRSPCHATLSRPSR